MSMNSTLHVIYLSSVDVYACCTCLVRSVMQISKYMSQFSGVKLLMGDFNDEPHSNAIRYYVCVCVCVCIQLIYWMLPQASHYHTHYHFHSFHFVLFKFKDKQHSISMCVGIPVCVHASVRPVYLCACVCLNVYMWKQFNTELVNNRGVHIARFLTGEVSLEGVYYQGLRDAWSLVNTEDLNPGYTFSALQRPHQLVKRVSLHHCISDESLSRDDQSKIVVHQMELLPLGSHIRSF